MQTASNETVTLDDKASPEGAATCGRVNLRRASFGGHRLGPANGDGNRVALVVDGSTRRGAPAAPRKGESGVYVAIANDFPFFKVGSSGDIRARLAALKWVMPGGMRLLAWWSLGRWSQFARERVEFDLHARLDRWAVAGEWFRAEPEALSLIESWRHRRPRPLDTPRELRGRRARLKWLVRRHAERKLSPALVASTECDLGTNENNCDSQKRQREDLLKLDAPRLGYAVTAKSDGGKDDRSAHGAESMS